MDKIKISDFEIEQVEILSRNYYEWNRKAMDYEECRGTVWIGYLEGKRKYYDKIATEDYWPMVCEHIEERLCEARKKKWNRIRIESRISMDKEYGETQIQAEEFLPIRRTSFVRKVIFWNDIKRLGKKKSYLAVMMIQGQEAEYIMKKLNMDKEQYEQMIRELRLDMQRYAHGED